MSMREIGLNELPKWSDWTARLLGLRKWNIPRRDSRKIKTEYNGDKYGTLLGMIGGTPADLRRRELREVIGYKDELCIAYGDGLYATSLDCVWAMADNLLFAEVSSLMPACRSIVELGSGWGYNLWKLWYYCRVYEFVGGDLCETAVEISKRMSTVPPVVQWDMLNSKGLPGNLTPQSLVFTFQAIEQLPSCVRLIDNLVAQGDRISAVVHIEPDYSSHNWSSLLGQLRRRYTEVNDYNRDLRQELERPDIEILDYKPNVFGYNPLNPLSVFVWRPK